MSDFFKKSPETSSRIHAKQIDRILGYKIPRIEVKLQQKYRDYYRPNDSSNKKQHFDGTQTWIGLHPQALLTPYSEIFDALSLLKNFDINNIIDIGAGYGRVGLVTTSLFPSAKFTGFEIVKQRGNEANRIFNKLNLYNCKIILQNVLDDKFIIPKADIYFIYDFSELDDICRILDQLRNNYKNDKFFLITKGDRIDFLLERKYKDFWKKNGNLTTEELKVYSSFINFNKQK